jgi:hypothetical protein
MNEYIQELLAFIRVYVTDDEFNHLGEIAAAELACKRDAQAAEQLRISAEDA